MKRPIGGPRLAMAVLAVSAITACVGPTPSAAPTAATTQASDAPVATAPSAGEASDFVTPPVPDKRFDIKDHYEYVSTDKDGYKWKADLWIGPLGAGDSAEIQAGYESLGVGSRQEPPCAFGDGATIVRLGLIRMKYLSSDFEQPDPTYAPPYLGMSLVQLAGNGPHMNPPGNFAVGYMASNGDACNYLRPKLNPSGVYAFPIAWVVVNPRTPNKPQGDLNAVRQIAVTMSSGADHEWRRTESGNALLLQGTSKLFIFRDPIEIRRV